MNLFKRKKTLRESGIFEGFTDYHTHILPGVDDGIKTMEEAIRVLEEYESLGIKKVWLTPHIMEDYPNATEDLKSRFEELKNHWQGKIELALASENMLDSLFEERLSTNNFLPVGDRGDHLLVETSYYTPPYAMDDLLEEARKLGYYIVLAHPERYRYMNEKDYKKLKEKGIKFQLNLLSLAGAYGMEAKKKAEWLLSHGCIDMSGTDIHHLESFINFIDTKKYKNILSDRVHDSI